MRHFTAEFTDWQTVYVVYRGYLWYGASTSRNFVRTFAVFISVILLSLSAAAAAAPKTILVSDLDDTALQSNVGNKAKLLINVFLNKRRSFPLLSLLYNEMRAANPSIEFYYVSGSPETSRDKVEELLENGRFPEGHVILRHWIPVVSDITLGRVGDTIFSTRKYKINTFRALFAQNPDAKFILVGDDVERDAEIYSQMAREFPGQVERIYIRRVAGRIESKIPRLRAGLPDTFLHAFDTEWDLAQLEYAAGRIGEESLTRIGTSLLMLLETDFAAIHPRFINGWMKARCESLLSPR